MRRRGRALWRRYGHAGTAEGGVYSVRYIHKISPSDKDVGPDVELPGSAFADRNKLGAALRKARVLMQGGRVTSFRVEGNKVVVFPSVPGLTTYWHAIVLTHQGGV